jgi:GTP pyrophosphokinase
MIFTPKGLLISLPKGASALDFAYEIHTEVGNKAIGAKINYKLNPINTVLNSGDQVEIITSDIAKPDKEWLGFVRTAKAKDAIRFALRNESKDLVQNGSEILETQLQSMDLKLNNDILKRLMESYESSNKEDLLVGIGSGRISPEDLKKTIKNNSQRNLIKYWDLKFIGRRKEKKPDDVSKKAIDKKVPFLLRENIENSAQSYSIAKCCNPIPGDEVVGYHAPDGTILIHKPKCPEAIRIMSNEGDRIIAVKWAIHKLNSFLARISMSGIDRMGLVNDITNIISSELKVNMTRINISVRDGIFEGTIDVYIHHTKDLNNLIMKISGINGIENVRRVEDFEGS